MVTNDTECRADKRYSGGFSHVYVIPYRLTVSLSSSISNCFTNDTVRDNTILAKSCFNAASLFRSNILHSVTNLPSPLFNGEVIGNCEITAALQAFLQNPTLSHLSLSSTDHSVGCSVRGVCWIRKSTTSVLNQRD